MKLAVFCQESECPETSSLNCKKALKAAALIPRARGRKMEGKAYKLYVEVLVADQRYLKAIELASELRRRASAFDGDEREEFEYVSNWRSYQ